MKPGFYFLMLLLIFTIITVSCNKNPESPAIPAQVDSLKPALPIQIIHTQDHTETDSVFYNYQTVSGGTKIITFVTFTTNSGTSHSDPGTYNFNKDFKLTENIFSFGKFTYTYNPNNSVDKVVINENTDISNSIYNYASGITDGKADVFRRALLGKDYYLPDLENLDPFYTSVDIDFELNNVLSITDPYHVTTAHYEYTDNGDVVSEDGAWTYELNDQKNVSKITFTLRGAQPEIFRLKY